MIVKNLGNKRCWRVNRLTYTTLRKLIPRVKFLFFVLFTFIGMLGLGATAHAATLGLSPSAGVFPVTNNFTVSVIVNTNQSINGVEGTLLFPTAKLEVVSISKKNSLLGLWVEEPSFSNAGPTGNVHFAGIKLNPGFVGNNGVVLDITFRVRDAGLADVVFGTASILANDGKGTNLVTAFGSGIYTLHPAPPNKPPVQTPVKSPLPPEIEIEMPSVRHFVQDALGKDLLFNTSDNEARWNNSTYAKFTWRLPVGTNGVALLLDDKPETDPGTVSNGHLSEEIFPVIPEGKNYLHIRFLNGSRGGPVLHYPVFVDIHPPKDFSIDFVGNEADYRGIFSTSNPRPHVSFFSEDTFSGIDYYSIKIGDGDWIRSTDLGVSSPYVLPKQISDKKKSIIVRAYDTAGNFTDATAEMIIEPVVNPHITFYPKNLTFPSDKLVVEGTAAPQAHVELVLKRDESLVFTVKADENGDWRFVSEDPLAAGTYILTAKQVLNNGAESLFTPPVYMRVNSWLWGTVQIMEKIPWYIFAFILVAGQALIFLYYRRRLKKMHQRLTKDMHVVKAHLQQSVAELQQGIRGGSMPADVQMQVKRLRKRIKRELGKPLTE